MAVHSRDRGWPITLHPEGWLYDDTGTPADGQRACRRCGESPTPDGHDACMGTIPGATSVCCGHGVHSPICL